MPDVVGPARLARETLQSILKAAWERLAEIDECRSCAPSRVTAKSGRVQNASRCLVLPSVRGGICDPHPGGHNGGQGRPSAQACGSG